MAQKSTPASVRRKRKVPEDDDVPNELEKKTKRSKKTKTRRLSKNDDDDDDDDAGDEGMYGAGPGTGNAAESSGAGSGSGSGTAAPSHSDADIAAALENFKTKCEECAKTGSTNHPNNSWLPQFHTLTIVHGKRYIKLFGQRDVRDDPDTGPRMCYAVIDSQTFNVYKPSDALHGTLNLKTADVKGNLFDAHGGIGQLNPESGMLKYKDRKPVSEFKSRKVPITMPVSRPERFIGKVFTAYNGSYSPASALRVVAVNNKKNTKGTRVRVQIVPMVVTHQIGFGGDSKIDVDWLARHLVSSIDRKKIDAMDSVPMKYDIESKASPVGDNEPVSMLQELLQREAGPRGSGSGSGSGSRHEGAGSGRANVGSDDKDVYIAYDGKRWSLESSPETFSMAFCEY